MTHTRAGSQDKFSYIGFQYYSLTWSCYHRQRLFTQRDRVDLVRSQFLRASQESDVEDVAYCFRTAVGYVIENPVRAGLVQKVEDYPFTGSSKHTMTELLQMAYEI